MVRRTLKPIIRGCGTPWGDLVRDNVVATSARVESNRPKSGSLRRRWYMNAAASQESSVAHFDLLWELSSRGCGDQWSATVAEQATTFLQPQETIDMRWTKKDRKSTLNLRKRRLRNARTTYQWWRGDVENQLPSIPLVHSHIGRVLPDCADFHGEATLCVSVKKVCLQVQAGIICHRCRT